MRVRRWPNGKGAALWGWHIMKRPWISRESYDRAQRAYDDTAAVQGRLLGIAERRYDELLNKYHALKLAGATIPEPVTPREAKEVDPLKQAVLNASIGKPPSVRAAMLKQLAEDVKSVEAGLMTAMDVQRRIETGFTPDDGIPE